MVDPVVRPCSHEPSIGPYKLMVAGFGIQTANRCADRSFALAASNSRFLGIAFDSSDASN
jgi:hypothetical protein